MPKQVETVNVNGGEAHFQQQNADVIYNVGHFYVTNDNNNSTTRKKVNVEGQRKFLKDFYQRKEHTEIKLSGDDTNSVLTLDHIYVNLVIVKEEEQRLREQEKLQAEEEQVEEEQNNNNAIASKDKDKDKENKAVDKRLGLLRTYEDIHKAKVPIQLKELFHTHPTKFEQINLESKDKENASPAKAPQKLLLLGRAGIGKSTLCKYLAYQWAQGQLLPEFSWVFHIELKRIAFAQDFKTLKTLPELLQAYYWPLEEFEAIKPLWEALETEKVLWLLDGYDEVAHLQLPLIEKRLLQQPYYLLTSRPYAAQPQRQKVDAILENIGLTPENVHQYIDKYFQHRYQQPEAGTTLKTWLTKQNLVASLCAIPIYLELLCSVWLTDAKKLQTEVQINSIELYNGLTTKLMRRLVQKIQPHPQEHVPEELVIDEQPPVLFAKAFLGRLAFEGLKAGRLLIEGRVFQQSFEILKDEILNLLKTIPTTTNLVLPPTINTARYLKLRKILRKMVEQTLIAQEEQTESRLDLLRQLLSAGFLKNMSTSHTLMKDSYYFLHLSFQEYFAALYLAYHLTQEERFIAQHKYDPAWKLTWTMVAGLLKEDVPRLNQFFNILLAGPRDLYGRYEMVLLMQCLEACGVTKNLNHHAALLKQCQAWVQHNLEQANVSNLEVFSKLPYLAETISLERQYLTYLAKTKLPEENINVVFKAFTYLLDISSEAVQALLAELKSRDELRREAAINALGQLQNPSAEVVPVLLAGAKDQVWEDVRRAAITGLGHLQNPNTEVVQELLAGAKDKEWSVRRAAITGLGQLQNPSAEVVPVLLVGTKDNDEFVRRASIAALGHLPNPSVEVVQGLLAGAKDKEWYVRQAAIQVLGRLQNPSAEVVQELLVGTKDQERQVRQAAIEGLDQMQNPSAEAVQELLAGAKDKEWDVRRATIKALGHLQNPNAEVVQGLLAGAKDKERQVRQAAIEGLDQMQNPSAEVVQGLLVGAKDKEWYVRQAAIKALGRLQNPSAEVVQGLLAGAKDQERDVRETAIKALGRLQNPSAEVVHGLLASAKDQKGYVRRAAIKALGHLQNPSAEVVQGLLAGAKDQEWDVREVAIESLGQMQNPSAEVVQGLLAGAKDQKWDVCQAAIKALGQLQNPSAEVVQGLLAGAKDRNKYVCEAAIQALGHVQNPSAEVVQGLLAGAKDQDWYVRQAAIQALGHLQNPSAEVVQELLAGAKDNYEYVRQTAIEALGHLPNPSAEVVQVLLLGAQDKEGYVREAAINVLGQLQNPSAEVVQGLLLADAKNQDLYKIIPLPHLIKAYPSWRFNQSHARLVLRYQLKQADTALIRISEKEYQCFINKQIFIIKCANPNQLEKDLEVIRPMPMLLKPNNSTAHYAFFKPAPASPQEVPSIGRSSTHALNL